MIDGIGRNAQIRLTGSAGSGAVARTAGGADGVMPGAGKPVSPPRLGELVRQMAASPPIDTARVAALRAAIADGSYAIDADAIAARMIAFDRGTRR